MEIDSLRLSKRRNENTVRKWKCYIIKINCFKGQSKNIIFFVETLESLGHQFVERELALSDLHGGQRGDGQLPSEMFRRLQQAGPGHKCFQRLASLCNRIAG